MSTALDDRRMRSMGFVVLMLAINLIDSIAVRSMADPGRRAIVAAAASVDVVVVVSLLYHSMLVRPKLRTRASLAGIVLASLLRATYLFPQGLALRGALAAGCEAALIGWTIVQVRRGSRRRLGNKEAVGLFDGPVSDPVAAVRATLADVLSLPGLVNLIATELGILYYALFCWRAQPSVVAGARAFTIHHRVGQAELFGTLPLVCLVEVLPVHLLLARWSATLAWTVTGASLYAAVWLLGLARAFRLRPVLVGQSGLLLRYGLLFQMWIPRETLARVRPAEPGDQSCAIPRNHQPRLCLELTQPLEAEGLFGLRRRLSIVAVTPDHEAAFTQALADLTGRESDRQPD